MQKDFSNIEKAISGKYDILQYWDQFFVIRAKTENDLQMDRFLVLRISDDEGFFLLSDAGSTVRLAERFPSDEVRAFAANVNKDAGYAFDSEVYKRLASNATDEEILDAVDDVLSHMSSLQSALDDRFGLNAKDCVRCIVPWAYVPGLMPLTNHYMIDSEYDGYDTYKIRLVRLADHQNMRNAKECVAEREVVSTNGDLRFLIDGAEVSYDDFRASYENSHIDLKRRLEKPAYVTKFNKSPQGALVERLQYFIRAHALG